RDRAVGGGVAHVRGERDGIAARQADGAVGRDDRAGDIECPDGVGDVDAARTGGGSGYVRTVGLDDGDSAIAGRSRDAVRGGVERIRGADRVGRGQRQLVALQDACGAGDDVGETGDRQVADGADRRLEVNGSGPGDADVAAGDHVRVHDDRGVGGEGN